MSRQYPPEFRQCAVRMIEESLRDHATEFKAIKNVASRLEVSPETVRPWRRQEEINAELRPGVSRDEHAEIERLKRESAERRRANEILETASFLFRSEARPSHNEMIRFIELFQERCGVEPIFVMLAGTERGFITTRGYRADKVRSSSARSLRDEPIVRETTRNQGANYWVFRVRKMHAAMRQTGW